MAFLHPGDELIVTRVDRLARSVLDLQQIVSDLREKGVSLKATAQPIDTATPAGKCFLDMLGVFAELETNLFLNKGRFLGHRFQSKPRECSLAVFIRFLILCSSLDLFLN